MERDVGRVLDQINNLLRDDLQFSRFVTFVVALLEPAEHTVRLLSAGLGPLFYYHASSDRVESFIAHNILFGLAIEISYGPPFVLNMNPGEVLVLITDGFFEWPSAQENSLASLASRMPIDPRQVGLQLTRSNSFTAWLRISLQAAPSPVI